MAHIVRIGNKWINLDRVTGIVENPFGGSGLMVMFDMDHSFAFVGDEETALRDHLRDVAHDLTPDTPEDHEFADYRKRGGTESREAWAALYRRHGDLVERYMDAVNLPDHVEQTMTELEKRLLI